ncbi:MAG: glycosyltransferase [Chloroflexota bacterium]
MNQSIERRNRVNYQETRIALWDRVARRNYTGNPFSHSYHRRLKEVYQFLVSPEQRILELGCGTGDLLASLHPSYGIGVEFSSEMLDLARKRHPNLRFVQNDVHDLNLGVTFDSIILSDLLNDLWDVHTVFECVARHCEPHTRVLINTHSRLWGCPLNIAQMLGLSNPRLEQNWLQVEDVTNLLYLSDFEVIRTWQEFILPLSLPWVYSLFNRFLVRFLPFSWFALANFILARPQPMKERKVEKPLVSVVVPARNEEGNIADIFSLTPEMGSGTELIFVEGHSRDGTYAEIERQLAAHPERRCQLIRQSGVGKGDAARSGFEHAQGDILMILDADLTVPPRDLPRFYEALISGKGEFINGVRLVYPMEKEAMQFINLVGNKYFSMAFSWLLGQSIKDTLCGTKALWKKDYDQIARNRSYFGDFDPFGDYDLLFGAAKLNRKIVDMPIRYRERTYGSTNIHRWKHGWLLIKMVAFAAGKIKFI